MPEQYIVNVGKNITAIRYGDKNGNWEQSAPARIANFVLGHDVETSSTVLNERMLDVVTPIEEFWDPGQNVAELEIIDKGAGSRLGIGLGMWLTRRRSDGRLRVVSDNFLLAKRGRKPAERPFVLEIEELIKAHKMDVATSTPSFVLATYLSRQWELFESTHKARAHWATSGDPDS